MSFARFVADSEPPSDARIAAGRAFVDTIGVALAGASEQPARIVQRVIAEQGGGGQCRVLATTLTASAADAALANGTAAHALDYDDMCFLSLAHPSAPLVAAALAAGDLAAACGRALLDAYVVGFEIEVRLGRVMNPRHYQRGWHCTSTLGTIGAAAAASRLLGLDATRTAHALSIAASEASGLKENFGTDVKPLHAGLAARNGVHAALLAKNGMKGSERAIDGPQGFLTAMDSANPTLDAAAADLGRRWEIVDSGITVKLYPSCAGTHPALDAVLDLRRGEKFAPEDVERIDIDVDAIVPTILIHDRPATGLEAKFSMPFCVAAAVAFGGVGIDAFEAAQLRDPRVAALMPRVAMRVDPALPGAAPALTQARVTVTLKNGRTLRKGANGARGYPSQPASDEELGQKFLTCARRTLPYDAAIRALEVVRRLESVEDVRTITEALTNADARSARARASTP
jgi:2-methylcitrate dehydratase PrpD